jgi:hypothetical protein
MNDFEEPVLDKGITRAFEPAVRRAVRRIDGETCMANGIGRTFLSHENFKAAR